MSMAMAKRTLLSIVQDVDNLPQYALPPEPGPRDYVPFHMTLGDHQNAVEPIGLLRQDVVQAMMGFNDEHVESTGHFLFHHIDLEPQEEINQSVQPTDVLRGERGKCVYFSDWIMAQGIEGISAIMGEMIRRWYDQGEDGRFYSRLKSWRDELYNVYCSPRSSFFTDSTISWHPPMATNVAFQLERAACPIFGVATFGVHMTAYEGQGDATRIWVPRRSKDKKTFPNMLDSTVGGGITAGLTPYQTILKECKEEASLPEDLLNSRLRACGATSFFTLTKDGFLRPEVEYVYDLPLPSSGSKEYVRPMINDDEVESFNLMSVPELVENLLDGQVKPNSALIYVDFLIRHGFVTAENEPRLPEIQSHTRRVLGVAMPTPVAY
uniref:Nudix hydrolase domain-containing protein n=1 Tax=Kwoniella dejecticola CBS 10117 TaxID=1296121 RepID=A0A1A6AET0_9TREE|nr:uncharacterized protein I303_00383 [Kwoniella dejecticola CBS 10117]OBR88566.1 hypothetical protein I303_00383 [Kwoniella dejecticola CBS 10117]